MAPALAGLRRRRQCTRPWIWMHPVFREAWQGPQGFGPASRECIFRDKLSRIPMPTPVCLKGWPELTILERKKSPNRESKHQRRKTSPESHLLAVGCCPASQPSRSHKCHLASAIGHDATRNRSYLRCYFSRLCATSGPGSSGRNLQALTHHITHEPRACGLCASKTLPTRT